MLNQVKLALRISTDAFDAEINSLISAAISEMYALGVTAATLDTTDAQIISAVIAYCKWLFGENDEADRWRDVYHIKLGQLKAMSGYTDWGDE